MFSHTATTSRQLLRHSDNTNLHLHRDDTFEGRRIMVDKGPFIREYLSHLKRSAYFGLS